MYKKVNCLLHLPHVYVHRGALLLPIEARPKQEDVFTFKLSLYRQSHYLHSNLLSMM